jgi:hypothetical protein
VLRVEYVDRLLGGLDIDVLVDLDARLLARHADPLLSRLADIYL